MTGSSRPVRFGVIGCGVIAYWSHLRELPNVPGAALVAAADPDPRARQNAARLCRISVLEDPAALLARTDIDAVIISAPSHLHASLACAAAAAGKHVYIEKPLAHRQADADAVLGAVRQARVTGVVGFNRRYHPLFEQARAFLASGGIGTLRAAAASFCEPVGPEEMPGWKRERSTGGGVLLDLASHHVDLLRWLLNDEIAGASARVESRAHEADHAWLHLRLQSGVEVNGFYSFHAARADFVELFGSTGILRVDRHRPALSLRAARRFGYGVRSVPLAPTRELLRWWPRRLVRPSYDPSFRRSLRAFVGEIQGTASHLASLEDGRRALEVLLSAHP
jgi:predicted dehydrogenase